MLCCGLSSVDLCVASRHRGVDDRAAAVGEVWILEYQVCVARSTTAHAKRGDVTAAVVELQRLAVRRGDTDGAVLAIDRHHRWRRLIDNDGRTEDDLTHVESLRVVVEHE